MLQAQMAAMEVERQAKRERLAALEAERAVEGQRVAALEAKAEQDQQLWAQLTAYVRGLAQTQGAEIPQFLLGQPPHTPRAQHDSTPVSMTNVCFSKCET
jgi:hypothetical protein